MKKIRKNMILVRLYVITIIKIFIIPMIILSQKTSFGFNNFYI